MSEVERSLQSERRPACDNCKTRKTKCDRRSPCASCVTLDVACRTTNRAGEKRQRVILSTKYEDAVQDVGRQLADVREMLRVLVSNKDAGPSSSSAQETSRDAGAYTPQSMIDEQVPALDCVQEGYHGDSSFTSHAYQIKTTLEATFLPSELEFSLSTPLADTSGQGTDEGTATALDPAIHSNDVSLSNISLPPNEIVLKLLRLVKTEQQRLFVDLPLFDQDEFIAMCRDIYFPTEPISLWTWICVNVGLHRLFSGISTSESSCRQLGTTADGMHGHTKILQANAEAALRSLRMCSEPSTESCRALAVLANFYVRQGHSTIAWRLISGAARAALDLGLHRLPSEVEAGRIPGEVGLFWHIYTWEKGLAMTCGKSPTIRHSDVTSGLHLLDTPKNRPWGLNTLYGAFVDMAIVMGEIQECLFSVMAQQSSQQIRLQHVRRLASRLVDIRSAVKEISPNDPSWEGLMSSNLGGISTSLDIILHCQLAIVYRFLPPEFLDAHPLQCSNECVDEARVALSMLVKVGEDGAVANVSGWTALLNTILCLVPLVPFIVLAGNAIATSSANDLPLLSKMVSLLAPVAPNSPLLRQVHGACESLSKIAERVVSSVGSSHFLEQRQHAPLQTPEGQLDYAFPMGQPDWDMVMMGFEPKFGGYDSRMLTNIMEPCFANTYR
ncbi:hypothetical protein F5X97DRAFT_306943 [Nemania serpens]|nr:hypothetical protein F5X97DRAFT_306943 [Nemania serpens]